MDSGSPGNISKLRGIKNAGGGPGIITPGPGRAGRDVNDEIMGSRDLVDIISTGLTYLWPPR